MSLRKTLILMIGLLVFAGLACSQAGEIMSPEEATALAKPTETPTPEFVTEYTYQIGDEVLLQDPNRGFLVLFVANAGSTSVTGQAPRGETATITGTALIGDVEWYEITAPGGSGWITLGHIQTPEE
jgi:hypothetical protein